MLSDFFRINMPYGIRRNDKNEWMCFNREYMPIGYNNQDGKQSMGIFPSKHNPYSDLPLYTAYEGLTEKILIKLADDEYSVDKDENGKIFRVFFYNDGSNPLNASKDEQAKKFLSYFKKLEILSKLKTVTIR